MVDDSSTDSTVAILKQHLAEDIRIRFILRTINSGRPSIPRNQALEVASSSRVVFLDIDDILPLDYCKYLHQDDSDNLYSGTKFCKPYDRFVFGYRSDFNLKYVIRKTDLISKNMIMLSGASFPKQLALSTRFQNIYLEDWEFWLDIVANCNVEVIKFLDVPIFYESTGGISPNGFIQMLRVIRTRGLLRFGRYLCGVSLLRLQEFQLSRRVCKASNIGCSG